MTVGLGSANIAPDMAARRWPSARAGAMAPARQASASSTNRAVARCAEARMPPDRVGGQALPGPVRDVVDDERDRAGCGKSREVRDNPGLTGAQERRHETERRGHLWPSTQCRHRLHRAGANQQLRRALTAHPGDHVDDATLLRGGQ